MNAYGADRVIYVELKVKSFNNHYDEYTRDDTYNGSTYGIKSITSCRYTDKTCEGCVETH